MFCDAAKLSWQCLKLLGNVLENLQRLFLFAVIKKLFDEQCLMMRPNDQTFYWKSIFSMFYEQCLIVWPGSHTNSKSNNLCLNYLLAYRQWEGPSSPYGNLCRMHHRIISLPKNDKLND